jgi:hypothetical protein
LALRLWQCPRSILPGPRRHVSRAFERLDGESVRQFAEEQYDHGWHRRRKHPRMVKIVGDPARRRLVLVDVKETNGQTGNGRLETAVQDGPPRVRT